MQIHALMLATFASLIAPFGGFFASGLKRTFKIKDFGDSIPGHGGMTDRMDCQFIMGFFAYMYYHTFIEVHKVTLGSVLETAITSLNPEEQVELVRSMSRYLANQNVVTEKVSTRPLGQKSATTFAARLELTVYEVCHLRRAGHHTTITGAASHRGLTCILQADDCFSHILHLAPCTF